MYILLKKDIYIFDPLDKIKKIFGGFLELFLDIVTGLNFLFDEIARKALSFSEKQKLLKIIRIKHEVMYRNKPIAPQARALLDTSELSLLMFLLGQYRGHQMSITPLVTRSVE